MMKNQWRTWIVPVAIATALVGLLNVAGVFGPWFGTDVAAGVLVVAVAMVAMIRIARTPSLVLATAATD